MNIFGRNNDPMDVDTPQQQQHFRTTMRVEQIQGRHPERATATAGGWMRSFLPGSDPHPIQSHGLDYGRAAETKEQRYRRERNEAEAEADKLKDEIKSLKQDLKRQQEAVSQTKESATRVFQTMQDKELFIGPQALDREVQGKFAELFKNVRSWTRHLATRRGVDLKALDPKVRKEFEIIAPGLNDLELEKILSNRSTTRYFLQGWVSLVIIEKLIPALADEAYPGTLIPDLWMEHEDAKHLFGLESTLYCPDVPYRDLNDWRAYTATLISKAKPPVELPKWTADYIFGLCHEIMNRVGVWSDEQDEQAMGSELQNILSEAVEFSKMIRTQRANWSVRYPIYHPPVPKKKLQQEQSLIDTDPIGTAKFLPFDHSTMKSVQPHEEDEDTSNKIVSIFVTPALFKRGDADGYKFDIISVIEPSAILWADGPTPAPAIGQRSRSNMPPLEREVRQPTPPALPPKRPQEPQRTRSHQVDVGSQTEQPPRFQEQERVVGTQTENGSNSGHVRKAVEVFTVVNSGRATARNEPETFTEDRERRHE